MSEPITGGDVDLKIAEKALVAFLGSRATSMVGAVADAIAAALNAATDDPRSLKFVAPARRPNGHSAAWFDEEKTAELARAAILSAFRPHV